MRFTRLLHVIAVLGLLGTPATALAVMIDATALTSPTLRIGGETGYISTTTVQNVPLGAGTYTFQDEANGIFSFDVDGGGLVSYDPSFESFLDGAGTSTLTVRGFDITVDATALTTPTFRLPHIFNSFEPTSVVKSVTVLPADFYGFDDQASNEIVFHVDYNGNVHFPAGAEDYLFGAGTPNLVVRGFDFTIDATALTSPTFRVDGITPFTSNAAVVPVTGIPGMSYDFRDGLSNSFLFSVDGDGALGYSATFENFLDGAGTTNLVVQGFTLTIDPCGLVPLTATMNLVGLLPAASTGAIHQFVGIPGDGYLLAAAGDLLFFTVDAVGHYANLAPTLAGQPVTGGGTALLGIGACAAVGSVAGRVAADCPAAGSPLLGVRIDAFEVGSGDLVGTAVTDAGGNYVIEDLNSGSYTITIVTPLGYSAATAEVSVTVTGGQAATADFSLQCVSITANPRTIGFWKHQVGVATGGNGNAQVDAAAVCSYLDLIAAHFNSNAINQVIVYDPPASGTCSAKLQVAKQLLNLTGSQAMIDRAKQQLMVLLLNVAAGYISQTQVISADGATVSQAITYCDNQIDMPTGNHERAKSIADRINDGQSVPSGWIPLGIQKIAYARKGLSDFQVMPNPAAAMRTFSFSLGTAGTVKLEIYDVVGRRIAQAFAGAFAAGRHTLHWDGRSADGNRLAQGEYFARLSTSQGVKTLRIVQAGF